MSAKALPTAVHASPILWGQDNPIQNAPALSEEEQYLLSEKKKALDKLLADRQRAKWKIEVFFGYTRRVSGANVGAISFWESGTKLHGGGDAKAYLCPGRTLKRNTCEAVIPDSSNGYGFLVCPSCKEVWNGQQVHGEVLGRWSNRAWADKLVYYFRLLGHNADLYLKYPKHDLRIAATREQEKQLMGEQLQKVRGDRVQWIYPLAHIIRDTANGADLFGRFLAFLTA